MNNMRHWQWVQLLILLLWCCLSVAGGNLWQETWANTAFPDPNSWLAAEDAWLFTKDASELLMPPNMVALKTAIATERLTVPDFTKLHVQTACQVQLDGSLPPNRVILFGPHEELKQIDIEVHNNTLDIKQENAELDSKHAKNVIIIVAINKLQELIQNGRGKISGRFFKTEPLRVINNGSGDVVLSGQKLNLKSLQQYGQGKVTVFGVSTTALQLVSTFTGAINLQGRVGVETIKHLGSGDINIIGVDTNNLAIVASGSGKIALGGVMDLQQLAVAGAVQVYLDKVHSRNIYAALNGHAIVGIMGETNNLYVDAQSNALFAGSSLFSNYGYLSAHGMAHINARAKQRVFTVAYGASSIYLIGKPGFMVPYSYNNSTIIILPPEL